MKNLSPIKNQAFQNLFASKYTPYTQNNQFIKLNSSSSQANVIYEQKSKRKLQVYQMTIQKQNFQNFIEVHQWRSKTSLPIIKSHYLNIIDEQSDAIVVEVYNEYIPFRLSQLNNIPINQGLYILKESLIAFDRLLEKFGSFYPNDKMIGINENNKCHVWLNQHFNENKCGFTSIKQHEFCSYILDIVQQHVTQNSVAADLWKKFRQNPTFLGIFKQIDIFQNQNGIKIPNKVEIVLMEDYSNSQLTQSRKLRDRKSSMTNSVSSSFKKKNSIAYQSQQTKVPQKDVNNFGQQKTMGVTNANTSDYIRLSPAKDIKNLNKTSQTSYNSNDITPKSPSTPLRHFKSNLKQKAHSLFRSSEVQDMFINPPKKQKIRKFSVKDQYNFFESQNPEKRRRKYEENDQEIDPNQKLIVKELLASNGWQKKIGDLFSTKNVRDSVIEGGDALIPERLIRCEKLDVFANNMVVSSMLQDEQ